MKQHPLGRQTELVVQELHGELLIYDLKIHKAFCLNETAALVWQACDGTKTVFEISRQLNKKFKTPFPEDLVWLALSELKKENLLVNGEEVANKLEGLSRREVIRKIGFASLITLPAIASLVAPTAASAQSVVVNPGGAAPGTAVSSSTANDDLFGTTCNQNERNQCASGQLTTAQNGTNTHCSFGPGGTCPCSCTCSNTCA